MTLRLCTLLALALSVCTGCAVVRWTTSTTRDYDYWGHLTLGECTQDAGSVMIPIHVNPLDGELWMDDGQKIWDTQATVEENEIFFNIRTCMAAAKGKNTPIAIHLHDLAPGTYQVTYRDAEELVHHLGEITVSE